MRNININLNELLPIYCAGYLKEGNFTTLEILLSEELAQADYYICAFESADGEGQSSKPLKAQDGKISVQLWQELLTASAVKMTVEAYTQDENGTIKTLGKSPLINLIIRPAVNSSESVDPKDVDSLVNAVYTATESAKEIQQKLDNGDFKGDTGSQGDRGEKGDTGEQGTPGRSVTSTTISDNHLSVSYSDGTVEDAGEIPGLSALYEKIKQTTSYYLIKSGKTTNESSSITLSVNADNVPFNLRKAIIKISVPPENTASVSGTFQININDKHIFQAVSTLPKAGEYGYFNVHTERVDEYLEIGLSTLKNATELVYCANLSTYMGSNVSRKTFTDTGITKIQIYSYQYSYLFPIGTKVEVYGINEFDNVKDTVSPAAPAQNPMRMAALASTSDCKYIECINFEEYIPFSPQEHDSECIATGDSSAAKERKSEI